MEPARRELPCYIRILVPVRTKSPGNNVVSFISRLLTPLIIGGLNIQGEDDSYDFGTGAGFYVDATEEPWNKGYKMYSYITEELPKTVFTAFPVLDSNRVSITGHSMGGHGALTMVCCQHLGNKHYLWTLTGKLSS